MRLTPKMEELVNKVIQDMETGHILPWEKPWFSNPMMNWKSKRPYHGINIMALAYGMETRNHAVGQFLTYNQAVGEGGQVRKGAKGIPVCYFGMVESKDKQDKFPLMKTSTVFNIEDVEGLKPREAKVRELTANQLGDKIIALSGAIIQENGAVENAPAFYRPSEDIIQVPERNLWKSDEGYYSTVLHELIHWTGHKTRLERPMKDDYSFEELVAEIGSSFLASFIGFKYETQHTSYIVSWCKGLKDKHESLYKACSQAQKACDYLLRLAGELPAIEHPVQVGEPAGVQA
jgi:antirestriction protein ArdC